MIDVQPRPKILFICGSTNQTTQMHKIAQQIKHCDAFFTPFYVDGFLDFARKCRLIEFTIAGQKAWDRCLAYFEKHGLAIDVRGEANDYDLVVTCTDLVIPRNIRCRRVVLVQEGMMEPTNWMYRLTKRFRFLPRWLANTSMTGLSHAYERFCVASEGYRDLFIRRGVDRSRIVVTGIPNFDDCARYETNDFPHRNYVLVCTSDSRETFKFENRRKFIRECLRIANGRPLVFKLHPNENVRRATREINSLAPSALVFANGSAEEMVANCDVLITRFSSVVYVGIALGKEVYSEFDLAELRRLTPLQNKSAANNIASVCSEMLSELGHAPPREERRCRPLARATDSPRRQLRASARRCG